MELATAISLIDNKHLNRNGAIQTWADLGCGSGLFTHALSSLLPQGSTIYAIDKTSNFDQQIIDKSKANVIFRQQDIEQPLDLPPLDGILMANILHYISDKEMFLEKLKRILKPTALFLVIEYNTDIAVTHWVPYPVSFNSLKALFLKSGFSNIELLNSSPSLYQRSDLYSALIRP